MKHKTAELTGALLDAAVAMAEGWSHAGPHQWFHAARRVFSDPLALFPPPYSSSWFDGGPIMEREGISPERHKPDSMDAADPLVSDGRWMWVTETHCGPTMLIAAMRAFVASKLGDEIELP